MILRNRAVLGPLALAVCLATLPAHAYGDPGSGALLWQLIVAGMVGFLFYFRQALARLKSLFGRKEDSAKTDAAKADET